MKKLLAVLLLVIAATDIHAQSLDRLRERATAFWNARIAGNRAGYSRFIEPGKPALDELKDARFIKADVSGIEFGDSATTAVVISKVRMSVKEGEFQREVRESWVWSGKDWFLRSQAQTTNVFNSGQPPTVAEVPPLRFEFSTSQLHLGKHVQGETVTGKLDFKTDRSRVSRILPGDSQGVSFGAIEWRDQEGGSFPISVDTSVDSDDIIKPAMFRIIDISGRETLKMIPVVVEIEGRIRFKQSPVLLDTSKKGEVELSIENLTDKPVRIKSVISSNPDFVLPEELKETLNPKEPTVIKISFKPQPANVGSAITIGFTENILGRPTVTFPLRLREEVIPLSPQVTPQQLEEIIRRNPGSQPRIPPPL